MNKIPRIVSGGQTGADRAALDWALSHNLRCGGWCPKGRKAEDGTIDPKCPLKESSSASYLQPNGMSGIADEALGRRLTSEALGAGVRAANAEIQHGGYFRRFDGLDDIARNMGIFHKEARLSAFLV